MKPFLIALQFMTRFPITNSFEMSDKELGRSVLFYPLIGLIVGFALCIVYVLFSGTNQLLVSAIVLLAWVIATGGLHLDGLADSADAWLGGHGDRERTLEIMKDATCGPAAVIALVLLLLVKFSALSVIMDYDNTLLFLLVTPVIGRMAVILLFSNTPYAREQGIAEKLLAYMPFDKAMITLLVIVGIILFLPQFPSLIVLAVSILTAYSLRWLMLKRIGGLTGDTTGAAIEITETVVLVTLAVV